MKWPDLGASAVWRLSGAAALLAAAALLTVSLLGAGETREAMTSVRLEGAAALARIVRADLDRAIGHGVPLDALPGVDAYLIALDQRLPDLRFVAVLGPNGQPLYRSGIEPVPLDAILARLPPVDTSRSGLDAMDAEAPDRARVDALALVRMPLRDGAGFVLVAVDSAEIDQELRHDLWASWPFWVGCLLLPLAWAAAAARGAVAEPAARLAAAMRRASAGRFEQLLVRRARDPAGQCLLHFNAAVTGLHARRQAAIVQAEDVCHAVFDQEVALAAATARDAALAALGPGLATPPTRVTDPRASDADVFAATLAAAGALGVVRALTAADTLAATRRLADGLTQGMAGLLDVLATAHPSLTLPLALALAAGAGALLGWRVGWRRLLAVPAAFLLLVAVLLDPRALAAEPLPLLLSGAVAAAALALAWGVALRQRRTARQAGSAGARSWPMLAGSLTGAALAWGLAGDATIAGLAAALLTTLALAAAATATRRTETPCS